MLTRTSEIAVQALLVLGLESAGEPASPRQLAERLDCSPSYLAKVLGMLVKARLLRSFRGARGGVRLARPADEITLLAVVEACQGLMAANYCRSIDVPGYPVCAFHQAMADVHRATVGALSRWTLADLLAQPAPGRPATGGPPCKMHRATAPAAAG
jgi:Rrf2 family protein